MSKESIRVSLRGSKFHILTTESPHCLLEKAARADAIQIGVSVRCVH